MARLGGGRARAVVFVLDQSVRARAWRTRSFCRSSIEQFQKSGLSGACICFEITETAAIASYSQANRFIHALKEIGCRFALDDFGTGLSSFGYLKHFPVDFLKIDGSFVKEILHDPIDREMVRSINEIGHLTGKRTIAEFAENAGDHHDAARHGRRLRPRLRRLGAEAPAPSRRLSAAAPRPALPSEESHREVDGADVLRQRADRDEVDAGRGDRRQASRRRVAGRLELLCGRRHERRAAHGFGACRPREKSSSMMRSASRCERLVSSPASRPRLRSWRLRRALPRGQTHGFGDAADRRDVILFDQNRVVEADAMVGAAAASHGVFLRGRSPGSVLRVSSTRVGVPASRATSARVAVAVPDSDCRKLSAVRSPVTTLRAGPAQHRRRRYPGAICVAVRRGATYAARRVELTEHLVEPRAAAQRAAFAMTTTCARPRRAASMSAAVRSPLPTSSARATRDAGRDMSGGGSAAGVWAIRGSS